MRVDRIKLIHQVRARIKELQDQSLADYEAAVQKEREREEAYVQKHAADWQAYAARILQRVAAGQAVLDGDKPDGLLREGTFRMNTPQRKWPQVAELSRLLALLEASPDETVSVPSLERAGIAVGRALKVG